MLVALSSSPLPPLLPLPPGPPATKDLGLRWLFQPYEFLRATAAEYGDTFTIDLGAYGPFVVYSNPRAIREIFTGDLHVFHAGAGNAVLRPFLGDGSLLLLEQDRHLEARRMLLPAFHGERIARYGALIESVTREQVARWQPGDELRMQDEMQSISLEVILRGTFGLEGAELGELRSLLRDFLNDTKFNLALIGRLSDEMNESAAWRAFRTSFARIHALVDGQIERCRNARDSSRTDMLHILLEARDEEGKGLTPGDLRDELLTLLVTGYETTATALAWALYWLHQNPTALRRLVSELSAGTLPRTNVHAVRVLAVRGRRPAMHRHGARDLGDEGRSVDPAPERSPRASRRDTSTAPASLGYRWTVRRTPDALPEARR
jgi:cytochrome P450